MSSTGSTALWFDAVPPPLLLCELSIISGSSSIPDTISNKVGELNVHSQASNPNISYMQEMSIIQMKCFQTHQIPLFMI